MTIKKIGFPKEITDDTLRYLEYLENGILKHSCIHSEIIMDKREEELRVTIKPSSKEIKTQIIQDILWSHRLMGIKIIFSKSLGASYNIFYSIKM